MQNDDYRALVAECRSSGITAKDWCISRGIEYWRYMGWATKVNRENGTVQQLWADVKVSKEDNPASEIRLKCGKWTVFVEKGFCPGLLADVLKAVAGVC